MSLLMLSVILVAVLVWSIYAMTRHSAIEREIQTLVETSYIEHLYAEYKENRSTLNLYVVAGFLLTLAYAVTAWGGGLDVTQWGVTNFVFAGIGAIAIMVLTLMQRRFYRDIKQQNVAALLVTVLVVVFVIFSELTTTTERESSLVRERSQESPTFKALLGHVQNGISPTLVDTSQRYVSLIATTEQKLSECKTQACRAKHSENLAVFQANLVHAKEQYQQALIAQRADTLAYAKEAKRLEYSEEEHSAVVRWIQTMSGGEFESAMLFAALLFVLAFEAGFHYIGTKEGIYVEAIARLGYSVRRKNVIPTEFLPRTAETHIPKRDTRQITQQPCEADNGCDTAKTEISNSQIENMKALHDVAKAAKADETVACPNCGTSFKKRAWNQAFCKAACKDNYWNVVKPERLKAARGG